MWRYIVKRLFALVIVLFRTVRIFDVMMILLPAAVVLVDNVGPSRGGR